MKTRILNKALDSASKGIMIQDKSRRVIFFNHACEEITKWPKNEIIGKDCGAIFKCHTSTGKCLTEKSCPGMKIFHGELTKASRELLIRRGDGSEGWVETSASAVTDNGGEVTHIVTVVEDIGERKRFSDEILKLKTLSTLGEFAAELAHEVKNPLNAMNIQMAILEREIKEMQKMDNASKKGLLRIASIVQNELIRLSGFIEECLYFSKTGELNKSNVNIRDLLCELASLLMPRAALNGIKLEFNIPDSLPEIKIDRDKIKQAILNLLINGIEAMPDGGILRLHATDKKHTLQLLCQDTGPGISAEIADKIFNLFYTTKDGGTGIGLSLAQNIIQAHGGTIKLKPSSEGSEFEIIIPYAREEMHD